jgi:hypothetical protein
MRERYRRTIGIGLGAALLLSALLAFPRDANATHICAALTSGPQFFPGPNPPDTAFVSGAAAIVCNRVVEFISVHGELTRTRADGRKFSMDTSSDICLADDRCDTDLFSDYVENPNDLWHVWASGSYEHDPERRNRKQPVQEVRSGCVALSVPTEATGSSGPTGATGSTGPIGPTGDSEKTDCSIFDLGLVAPHPS